MGTDHHDEKLRPRRRRRPLARRGWNLAVIAVVAASMVLALGLVIWGGVYLLKPKSDSRLLGTWKSDADATIAHRKTTRPVTEQNEAAMRKLFGKMLVTYTAKHYTWELDGTTETLPYQVVNKDAESVTIKVNVKIMSNGEPVTLRIRFPDADTYWVDTVTELMNFSECFRRVK